MLGNKLSPLEWVGENDKVKYNSPYTLNSQTLELCNTRACFPDELLCSYCVARNFHLLYVYHKKF